jgi:hypothetical protein
MNDLRFTCRNPSKDRHEVFVTYVFGNEASPLQVQQKSNLATTVAIDKQSGAFEHPHAQEWIQTGSHKFFAIP